VPASDGTGHKNDEADSPEVDHDVPSLHCPVVTTGGVLIAIIVWQNRELKM
jgi:hypothetical protein